MRKLITLIILLVIGFGLASAKKDYNNPVKIDTIAILEMTNKYNKTVYRYMFVDVDKYDNYFISINVTRFTDEGDDDIQIKVKGIDYKLRFRKNTSEYAYSYYTNSYIASTTTIGNTTTTTVEPEIKSWYYWYSIYPISKELYDLIKNNGIEEMKVDGVSPIIVHKDIHNYDYRIKYENRRRYERLTRDYY